MRLWRLSGHRSFDGEGARRFGGRWNRPGVSVIYAAATLALATLEFIVHVDRDEPPAEVFAHIADIPDDIPIEQLGDDVLPTGWQRYPAPEGLQDIGSSWAAGAKTMLLSVPSSVLRLPPALVPTERNYLINPTHAQFAHVRARSLKIALDPRMWS